MEKGIICSDGSIYGDFLLLQFGEELERDAFYSPATKGHEVVGKAYAIQANRICEPAEEWK